jgi:hypothetical protein
MSELTMIALQVTTFRSLKIDALNFYLILNIGWDILLRVKCIFFLIFAYYINQSVISFYILDYFLMLCFFNVVYLTELLSEQSCEYGSLNLNDRAVVVLRFVFNSLDISQHLSFSQTEYFHKIIGLTYSNRSTSDKINFFTLNLQLFSSFNMNQRKKARQFVKDMRRQSF